MLNEIRFTGSYARIFGAQATINGNSLLLVKNLQGQLPRLSIDAAHTGAADFKFHLENELQLLDDLEIAGNGTELLVIHGAIRDYDEPRGVMKRGSSRVKLAGDSRFRGTLSVEGGRVTLEGAAASISGAAGIVIGNQGEFELASGTVSVSMIDNSAGGIFDFRGGTLKTGNVIGNLVNDGGTFAPGPGNSTITGDFTQHAGSLELDIGRTAAGNQSDSLEVGGVARLGGELEVKFIDGATLPYGEVIQVLSAAGGIIGDFDQVSLPTPGNGLYFTTLKTDDAFSLAVELTGDYNRDGSVDGGDYVVWRNATGQSVAQGAGADGNWDGQINVLDLEVWRQFYNPTSTNLGLMGDYNRDGRVDSGDYVVWRRTKGESVSVGTSADGNRDGRINELDFNLWKSNFGGVNQAGTGKAAAAVPEPATCLLVALAVLLAGMTRSARH
jgi:hypothetical protein